MSFILRGPFLKSLQIPPVGLAQPRVFYYFFDGFILGNMIVVMTLPYKFNDLTGEAVREEVIVTKFSSTNLHGKDIPIYGHQLICLNPNHPEADTPVEIRDWLDLFYQSIHSPERPKINVDWQ